MLAVEPPVDASTARRSSLRHRLAVLVIASLLLMLFILLLGDFRRRDNAVKEMARLAEVLRERLGEGARLPLNLELPSRASDRAENQRMEFLSRDDARVLRDRPEAVLAAWTALIRRAVLPEGRGVVLFEDGRFHVKWMQADEFDRVLERQQRLIREHAGGPPPSTGVS